MVDVGVFYDLWFTEGEKQGNSILRSLGVDGGGVRGGGMTRFATAVSINFLFARVLSRGTSRKGTIGGY